MCSLRKKQRFYHSEKQKANYVRRFKFSVERLEICFEIKCAGRDFCVSYSEGLLIQDVLKMFFLYGMYYSEMLTAKKIKDKQI